MTTDKHNKRPNVPPLRFPEFSGEWERSKLGYLTTKVGSGSTPRGGNSVYIERGHCFVRSQNVGMGVLLLDDIAHIDDNTHKKQIATEIKENDVLLNITGASIGRTAVATYLIAGGNVNQHVCIIRTNDLLNHNYLCNYIQTKKIQNYIYSLQTGGSREGLNFEQVRSFPICYPSEIEQIKISHLISLLDRRIAIQSGLIEDLKNIKKYLMEQLFCQPKEKSPRLRLGGMSGEWKRVRLCDVVERVSTRNKTNECTRVLTIAAQYGLIDHQEFFNKQIASSDLTTYYLLHRGDFAYNKSYSSDYPWGAVKRLDNYDEGVLSSLYICFCPNHSIDSDFLRHYFESTKWHRGISEISGEGARNHGLLNMSVDDYFNTTHRFPSIEEQTCISHVLNTFDRKVLIEESILEKLRRKKSYLLNNMFI